jgi:lysophospholipid acyltransferase (LPLAT)-like uncharacterized protein
VKLSQRIAASAGGFLLDRLMATTRYDVTGEEEFRKYMRAGQPVIFVLWHSRLLPLSYSNRQLGLATLISQSADGEYIASMVRSWGYTVVRGSSSRRGSAALRDIVRCVRAGQSVAITPDGPRGPMQKMKPGALLAAQLTGAPLIPAAAWTPRAWWIRSWDRFLVPKPFARVRSAFGAAHFVPRDASAEDLETRAQALEDALNELMRIVEA